MASAQSSVEMNTTGSSEERDRQLNAAAMLLSTFSDETPPSSVPVNTGVGGTMEERVAAYKERKERMKQQRKEKATQQARKKEWFDMEMEKPYTEQQAIEEMLQHPIPQDWTSLRGGSRDFPDQPTQQLYASNASEASSGSLSSTSSVSSSVQVVHEQVAWMVNGRRSGNPGPGPEDSHARGERRAWTTKGAENRPAPVANAGYAPTYDGFDVKRKQVTRIRVEL